MTAKELRAGDVYEGYRLGRLLGQGTFAWVFEAHSPQGEEVAFKVSREPVMSEETALRALREIRILGSLTNPHVVSVYDHGLGPDERWYMVMELLRGEALSTQHDFDVPLDPPEAVRIIHQACLGLDEAHRAGVVHRDIKPDNLWVSPDGTIKVLDFGLARAWGVDGTIGANATAGHMLIGTPHYAQPEQVKTGTLTPASDVYSLGVVLYELLVGRTPLFEDERCSEARDRLEGNPLQWLIAHVKQPIVPIDRYPEGARLPRRLIAAVHEALAKEPTDRPATAGVFANRLAQIMHHDFETVKGAILKVRYPSGANREHVLLPGVHRIGVGRDCEVCLAVEEVGRVFAVLEWSGGEYEAEINPLTTDGTVKINGHVLDYRVRLVPGTFMDMGPFHLELTYPGPVVPR